MLDLSEFGRRVQVVREHLDLSQVQLASKLETNQVLISRLENGLGASIDLLFKFVNFLNSKKLPAYQLFITPFNIDAFTKTSKIDLKSTKAIPQIQKKVSQLQTYLEKERELVAELSLIMKMMES